MVLKAPPKLQIKAPQVSGPVKPIEGLIKVAFGVGIITGVASLLK